MIDKRISYAFGGTGGRTGGTGGRGNGSADRGGRAHQAAAEKAQKSARDASADRGGQAQKAAAEKAQKAARDTAREKAIETAAKTVKTKAPTRHHAVDTPTQKKEQAEIDLGTLEKARTAPITLPKKYKTVPTHVPHRDDTVPTEIRDFYSPTGYQDLGRSLSDTGETWGERAEAGIKRGGIMGTLGKIALGVIAPQLLAGTKLAAPYSMYNKAKTISKYAKDFGLTEKDIVSSLTSKSNVKNLAKNIGKRSTIDTTTDTSDDRFGQRDGDGRQVTEAPKADVVTESVQKFTPRQMDLVRQRHNQLQQAIQTGTYNGQRLNDIQLTKLGEVSKQMESFLVDPQKMMMMARGGLAGLHG